MDRERRLNLLIVAIALVAVVAIPYLDWAGLGRRRGRRPRLVASLQKSLNGLDFCNLGADGAQMMPSTAAAARSAPSRAHSLRPIARPARR